VVHHDNKKGNTFTSEEREIQLESLRNQLDLVRKEKSELESKESKIQNMINKLIQGE